VPLAKIAARVMAGRKLADLDATVERVPPYFSVKEAVFPFGKFPDATDSRPEMKSTGRSWGPAALSARPMPKSQAASGIRLPTRGVCLVIGPGPRQGGRDCDREAPSSGASRSLRPGTQTALEPPASLPARAQGARGPPHIVDMIKNDEIDLIINTTEASAHPRIALDPPRGGIAQGDLLHDVAAANATCDALDHLEDHDVNRLQDLHRELGAA
jgi:carbamoyl-phosphate synthase large subunit